MMSNKGSYNIKNKNIEHDIIIPNIVFIKMSYSLWDNSIILHYLHSYTD